MTTYTYTDLIDPSAASNGDTQPVAINDKGQVTGSYFNGTTTSASSTVAEPGPT